jgi:iron complex transport system permease protein
VNSRVSPRTFLLLLLASLVAASLLHLGVSRELPGMRASLTELLHLFGIGASDDPVQNFVVTQIRLPRLVVAMFGGASLGLAGAVMQAAFRNPIASPDIVGTAAGAAFGGVMAIVTQIAPLFVLAVPLCSLSGALVATWLVFVLAGTGMRFSTTGLLLAGVALNTLIGALTSFAVTTTFDNYSASSTVLFWLMGGLDSRTWEHAAITAGGCALFAVLVTFRARDLDVLTLRDDSAFSLGIDAGRVRRQVLWCACGLVATTVANTGGIAFVGLVVPHLARLLAGPAHRVLLPASALLGALLLVLADLLCRNAPADWSLRLGVVTSALGAPYFLYLLARHRRGEALR